MANFVFHLDPVLRHRRNVERQRQVALAEAQAQMAPLQATLDALDQAVRQSVEDLRKNRLTGTLDMTFLAAHRRFLNSSHKNAIEIAQQMAQVKLRVDAARRELADAARQRKIVEKLREKQYQRWMDERSRSELAMLDEVGMQIAYGNSTEAGHQGAPLVREDEVVA